MNTKLIYSMHGDRERALTMASLSVGIGSLVAILVLLAWRSGAYALIAMCAAALVSTVILVKVRARFYDNRYAILFSLLNLPVLLLLLVTLG